MEKYIKYIWYKLITYVSKEQAFLIFLYLAFAAYLENTETGNRKYLNEIEEINYPRRLREIFKRISGYELKRAVNDFEESIVWEEIAEEIKCDSIVKELDKKLKTFIQSRDDLEKIITVLQGVIPELDNLQLTPESLNKLIAVMPVNAGTASMAELYCGLAGTGLTMFDKLSEGGMEIHMVCEEQRKLYCDIAQIRMFCHGIKNPEVFQHDILADKEKYILTDKPQNGYGLVIADLPKGNNESIYVGDRSTFIGSQKKLYTEWVAIQKILERVNENGKAIIIVTKGALVRQREKEIRAIITMRDWLEAVITLPAHMYASTHIRFEVLIINKQKPSEYRGKVFMADIDEDRHSGSGLNEISSEMIANIREAYENLENRALFSAVVSLEEIEKKEFSWNPFLYIRLGGTGEKDRRTVELGMIAEIMRGAQITKAEEQKYSGQATHYWLNIRNIENGSISFDENSMLRAKSPDWEVKFGIQEDDIIMTSKGSALKICMVEPDMPKAFLCGNLTRIRVDKNKYSPYVLYEFLISDEGQAALDSIQSGTTIKVYNNTNLSRLQVPYYENAKELQGQLKQVYQEYQTSAKEIKIRFETKRKQLLGKLH